MNVEWVHDEDDKPRAQRDTSRNFAPGQVHTAAGVDPDYAGPVSPYSAAAVEPAPTMEGTDTTSDADCVRIVREFLEDAGVLSSTEGLVSIAVSTCADVLLVMTHR